MISALTWAIVALSALLMIVAGVYALRDRLLDDLILGLAALIELGVIVQTIKGLIGMGAIVMDEAVVEENCLIAAGAVILEKTVCHAGGVYAGVPARRVKEMTPELFKGEVLRIANNYVFYSSWFKDGGNTSKL